MILYSDPGSAGSVGGIEGGRGREIQMREKKGKIDEGEEKMSKIELRLEPNKQCKKEGRERGEERKKRGRKERERKKKKKRGKKRKKKDSVP